MTSSTSSNLRFYGLLGHVFFVAYFLFCYALAHERFLSFDAAFYTFELLNNEDFSYNNARYICYFTQCLAVLSVKMGMSLSIVITAYSITFALWYYLMFLFVKYVLKNAEGIILLICTLCLATRYKHYAGHTEVVVAGMVAMLLFIWVTSGKEKLQGRATWKYWSGMLLLCALLFIIHPVIVVPLIAILVLDMVDNGAWRSVQKWGSVALVVLTFVIRFLTINTYETKRVSSIGKFSEVLLQPEKYPHVYEIMGMYFGKEYVVLSMAFVVSIFFLMYRKKRLLAIGYVGAVAGLIVMVILSHAYLSTQVYIMIDGYLGMLGMVVGLCLVHAWRGYIHHAWFRLCFIILVLISCFQIYQKHTFFESRTAAIRQTFDKNPDHKKLFVVDDEFSWKTMWYPYALPVESLMITCMEGTAHCKALVVEPKRVLKDASTTIHDTIHMMDRHGAYINDKYFVWHKGPYKVTDKVGWE